MMHLLRPLPSGIFWPSIRFHSPHYARETIAKICSPWVIALRSPRVAPSRGSLVRQTPNDGIFNGELNGADDRGGPGRERA